MFYWFGFYVYNNHPLGSIGLHGVQMVVTIKVNMVYPVTCVDKIIIFSDWKFSEK